MQIRALLLLPTVLTWRVHFNLEVVRFMGFGHRERPSVTSRYNPCFRYDMYILRLLPSSPRTPGGQWLRNYFLRMAAATIGLFHEDGATAEVTPKPIPRARLLLKHGDNSGGSAVVLPAVLGRHQEEIGLRPQILNISLITLSAIAPKTLTLIATYHIFWGHKIVFELFLEHGWGLRGHSTTNGFF